MLEWLPEGDEDLLVERYEQPPCPNCSSRDGLDIDAVTLHFTVGKDVRNTIVHWSMTPEAKGAAHLYVGRDGQMFQIVPFSKRAWHHGRSEFEYDGVILTSGTDRCSIGIEMANIGQVYQDERDHHWYYLLGTTHIHYPAEYLAPQYGELKFKNGIITSGMWEPYPFQQVLAVRKLVVRLVKEFNIPLERIVGHEDVAMPEGKRKWDPGPMWDWKTFIANVAADLGTSVPDDVWRLHKTVS
jgi:N-acetylmuramoyl-L-alanine amidase